METSRDAEEHSRGSKILLIRNNKSIIKYNIIVIIGYLAG